jgi:hypothetical protein
MSENNENEKKEEQEQSADYQQKSERRTAAFLARRLGDAQDHLYDLLPDLRTFDHYEEMDDLTFCMRFLQKLKSKYRKFADDGVWPEKGSF